MTLKTKPDRVILIDSDGAALIGATSCDAHLNGETGTIAASVAELLRAAPLKRRSKVLVAAADIFRQTVRLRRAQSAGLTDSELASVLSFEVEPFSDIHGSDGKCAFVRLADESGADVEAFDVVQVTKKELSAIDAAIRRGGGTFIGVCGIPDGWKTCESDTLSVLFGDFADKAAETVPKIAVVVPEKRNLFTSNPLALGGVIIGALTLCCATDYARLVARYLRIKPEVEARRVIDAANQRIESDIASYDRRMREIVSEREKTAAVLERFNTAQSAWCDLLRTLSENCGDDTVVSTIHPNGDGCVVECVGTTAEAAVGCMSKIAAKLSKCGWNLNPGAISETLSGGLVKFSFKLVR